MKLNQVIADLRAVFLHPDIPTSALRHLLANRHRLTRGAYVADGQGCMMYLLTETLAPDKQIRTKADLTRFFGRESGTPGTPGYVRARESPEYQPAKWLVRVIDGHICPEVRRRYGNVAGPLPWTLPVLVCAQVLEERELREEAADSRRMAVRA